jgi:hypothetical protein
MIVGHSLCASLHAKNGVSPGSVNNETRTVFEAAKSQHPPIVYSLRFEKHGLILNVNTRITRRFAKHRIEACTIQPPAVAAHAKEKIVFVSDRRSPASPRAEALKKAATNKRIPTSKRSENRTSARSQNFSRMPFVSRAPMEQRDRRARN